MSESGRQFIQVYFDFIESKAFDNLSGNALKLYLRMRRYVCRARSGHSLCDFYIKGLLAMSGYLNQYAKAFGVSKSSVCRWLKELEDAKFIVSYYKAQKGANQPNIWILGRVLHVEGSKHSVEIFFVDHEALAQESDEEIASIFDQSKSDVVLAKMTDSAQLYNKGYTVAPMQQCVPPVQQCVPPVQRSNREELIDKTNSPPPKKQADKDPVKEEEYVDLDDDGYPSKRKRPLIKYIEQNANRKLTPNQQIKLAGGVPLHSPQHPSPCTLFEKDPLFREYIDGKIAWATGGVDGSKRQTQRMISTIRNYDHEHYGWLIFKQGVEEEVAHHGLSRFKPVEEPSEEDLRGWEDGD